MEQTDTSLIDEFDKLQNVKKDLEIKEEELRKRIIALAEQKHTNLLFGTHKKCSIKEFQKIVYPEDKTQFVALIKAKGLYDTFSSLNYLKLSPKIIKGEIDKDIIDLVKKEKAYRVSLIDKGV